jgi:hypothetical protein
LRAFAGVAELLWALGDRACAIELNTDMLRLNRNGNQGVRYTLATCMPQGRAPEARVALLEPVELFPCDGSANWAYSRPLRFFQMKGQPTDMAKQGLSDIIPVKPDVPPLLSDKPMPWVIPRYIDMGDIYHAVEHVAFAHNAWRQTSSALPWLHQHDGKSKVSQTRPR